MIKQPLSAVDSASFADIVEQWKSQALRSIGRQPERDEAPGKQFGFRFSLLAEWFRGLGQAHDAALGVEKLIAKAEGLLQADDPNGAAHVAQRLLAHALREDYRTRLWLVTAWAGIGQRNPFLTHAALQQLPAAALTLDLVTAYLTTCNRADEATVLLKEARRMGHRSRATSKQLIDLLVVRDAAQEASRVANEDLDLLSGGDLAALVDAGLFVSLNQANPDRDLSNEANND
jgi:hypothetical protein